MPKSPDVWPLCGGRLARWRQSSSLKLLSHARSACVLQTMALPVTVAAETTHSAVRARHAGPTRSQATLCCTPVWALPGKALLLCWGHTAVASPSRLCEVISWLHYGRVMAAASAKREAVSWRPCRQEKINLSGVPAPPGDFCSLLTRALSFPGSVSSVGTVGSEDSGQCGQ